jgi:hypothetical protein
MNSPAFRWIDARISDALARAFDRIDAYQRDGYCTREEVVEALGRGWGDAIADAWREYNEECI